MRQEIESLQKQIHYNKPQLRSMSICANQETAIWARGTGKSTGLIAPRAVRNMERMPRSRGVFVGATYMQLLERTLPPVISQWQEIGYQEGIDFWVRKKPPRAAEVPVPINGPLSPEHAIYWKDGSVISLVSQDRPGSSNSMSVDWIMGDEAKFLNYEKLTNELLLANRGNERYFRDKSEHHSVLFCSDMPTAKSARWLLQARDQEDKEQIRLILAIVAEVYRLESIRTPGNAAAINNKIARYEQSLNELRRTAVYFSLASSLDNIHALGVKTIKQWKRMLPDFIFQTAVLNREIVQIEDGFYPLLDEELHGYFNYEYSYIEDLGLYLPKGTITDCRKDGRFDRYQPLSIAFDYGGRINTLVVGQRQGNSLPVDNALYEKNPKILQDLVNRFCDYYTPFPTKHVHYHYDQTAIARKGDSTLSFKDQVVKILRERGWTVNEHYFGITPSHHARYLLWNSALKGDDPRLLKPSFNRENCKYLLLSMQQAGVKETSKGFEKDKGSERSKTIDQREATHFSDAVDTLYWGEQHRTISTNSAFVGNMLLN